MPAKMKSAWSLSIVVVALLVSACAAFHVPVTNIATGPSSTASGHRRAATTQPYHVSSSKTVGGSLSAGTHRTMCRELSMTSGKSDDRSSGSAQRIAAMAAVTSVVTLTGSATPAHADNFAQLFAEGIVGAINGPGILAIPIVLGFGLATSVALFIFFMSQPREYDD